MSVLILSNSAPNYHFFFNSLAKIFSGQGDTVVYAVDSRYSRLNNHVDDFSDYIYVFTEFASVHETNESLLESYSDYNLNYALLSDFERAEAYKIWNKNQFSNDYLRKLKSALLTFFEKIIDENQVEVILYENVSNTFAYFAYIVASRKGKKYVGFSTSRLPGRFEISKGPFDFEKIKDNFEKIKHGKLEVDDETKKSVKEYIKGIEAIEPDYMSINNLSKIGIYDRYLNRDKALKLLKLLFYFSGRNDWDFQVGSPLKTHVNLFFRNLFRRLKCSFISRHYDEYNVGSKFFLYPLHFHPESSTSVLSGNNLDEYEVIKSIAFNLPEGAMLFVKDHKSAWGFPSIKFYRDLKRLPNVKVLSPDEPTKQLIKKSVGVITLTSTVGYEALLLEKPVVLIGRVFYEFHKSVLKLRSREDIFSVLSSCLSRSAEDINDYNQCFVQAYWMSTHKGSLNLLNEAHLDVETANNMVAIVKRD